MIDLKQKKELDKILSLINSDNESNQLNGVAIATGQGFTEFDLASLLLPKNEKMYKGFSINLGGRKLWLEDRSMDGGERALYQSIHKKTVEFCCVVGVKMLNKKEVYSERLFFYTQLTYFLLHTLIEFLKDITKDYLPF